MVDTDWRQGLAPLVGHLETIYASWDGAKQFQGTIDRLVQMFGELCWSPERIKTELDRHTKLFEDGYAEVMTIPDIQVVTLCPHHLLPCEYRVDISYSPGEGRVLGLSKFARIAVILGKRPIMQEMYTRELADQLFERIKPKGVQVKVIGSHGCMRFRGVLQPLKVQTMVTRGELSCL